MTGIYKSRLFNFLNRQKIRLTNQLGITFRHFQLATETGVKTLLYPVYMLARTSISLRQRLKSDSQPSATQDKISEEKSISENDFWLEDEETNLPVKPDISGLTKSHKVNLELSQSRQDNSGVIAPIRFFRKMWNRVRTSPLASGSSQNVESRSEQESFQGLIRRAIAYFFGNKQQLLSSKNQEALPGAQDPEGGEIQLNSVNLPVVNSPRSQESNLTFFAKVGGWLDKVKANITRSHDPEIESTEQESLQGLIRRAIAYFFGNKQQLVSGTNQKALPSGQNPEGGPIQVTSVNLPVVNYPRSQESNLTLFAKVGGWLEKVKANITHSHDPALESTEQESFQSLIRRAIAYFFGDKQQLVSGTNQEALPSAGDPEGGQLQLTSVNLPVVNDSRSQESNLTLFAKVGGWLEKVKANITRSDDPEIESTEQESLQILIRRAIAYFFGHKQQLVSGTNQEALPSGQNPEGGEIQLISVHLTVANDLRSQESNLTFFAKVGGWLEKVTSNIASSKNSAPESVEQDSWGIQVLIRRAIAYFFGNKQQLFSGTNSPVLSSFDYIDDNLSAALPFSSFSLPAPSKTLSVTLPFKYWNLSLPSFDQEDNSLSAIGTESIALETVALNICSESILSINQTKSENLTNIPLEFSSDFWEAEVITIGYVKNLLERILEFIDKIIWWIEKQFVKLWQFFQSLITDNC
ncbi:MAG: hypothetical protein AAGA80_12310 [Cyanobacteria bacterium P01_F01_bin.143]